MHYRDVMTSDGVSNHQPHDCLLNRSFRRRWKKTSKLRVTGFSAGNSPMTGEFPAQRASNAESVSIWWRHYGYQTDNSRIMLCFKIINNRSVCWNPAVRKSAASTVDLLHDDVIKWKHFPRYWPFLRGIHRSHVVSPNKGKWRGALMFPLICAWTNSWANNVDAGDLRHHLTHYDVTVMSQ